MYWIVIAVKNPRENLATFTIWSHNETTSTREPTTRGWISADVWRHNGAICSKNRKIVPYHHIIGAHGSQDFRSPSPIMAPALTSFLTRRDSELDQSINQLVLYLDRQTIDTCNYNCNSNYIRQSKLMWSCEQEMIYYKSIIIITVNRHKTFKTTF